MENRVLGGSQHDVGVEVEGDCHTEQGAGGQGEGQGGGQEGGHGEELAGCHAGHSAGGQGVLYKTSF